MGNIKLTVRINRIVLIVVVLLFQSTVIGFADDSGDGRSASVPDSIIKLGSVGSYGFVVRKADSRLDIYQQISENEIVLAKSYRTSTGQVAGDKLIEGDLKTPEGIYFMVRIREDNELMSKYGRRAFDLNYPNQFDKLEHKTGYGIWLHGTDEPERLEIPRTSEGCVVISNENIEEISEFVTLYRTPIIISEEVTDVDLGEHKLISEQLSTFVQEWLTSWAQQDYEKYVSYYDEEAFQKSRAAFRSWKQRKQSIFWNTAEANIEIADLKIFKEKDRYTISFYQRYRSNLMDDTGIKWIYLQKNEAGENKIVREEWFPVTKAYSGKVWNKSQRYLSAMLADIDELELDVNGKLSLAEPEMAFASIAPEPEPIEQQVEPAPVEIPAETLSSDASAAVEIQNFRLVSQDSEQYVFGYKLMNMQQDSKKRGWVTFVAQWEDGYSSFPSSIDLNIGVPQKPSQGDSYGIRWFKEDSAILAVPAGKGRLIEIVCYIFDRDEKLISIQKLPISQ
jgi:murein L,D-transpeptidase YafK